MKTNVQHMLLGGIIAAIMAVASTAQANVISTEYDSTVYSAPSVLTDIFVEQGLEEANQPVVKLVQKKISASKAKKIARTRVRGGEVVDVSLRKSTYKVRVIAKNGRVVDVLIDANTGRVK